MSMTIGGAASSTASTTWQNRRQDFGSLVSSIKNGDLTGAQQAFAALSGTGSPASTTSASSDASTTTPGNGNSPQNDLAAIGQALDKGDISGAQQALAKLFADRTGGGHHHHHGGGAPAATSSTPATTTPSVSPSATISILV
jgi:hypothetical protein